MPDIFRMRIASKRQITLPQKLVSQLHLDEGDEIEIVTEGSVVTGFRPLKLVPVTFFTDEILEKLREREHELKTGGGLEVGSPGELRNRSESRYTGAKA